GHARREPVLHATQRAEAVALEELIVDVRDAGPEEQRRAAPLNGSPQRPSVDHADIHLRAGKPAGAVRAHADAVHFEREPRREEHAESPTEARTVIETDLVVEG